MKRDDEYLRELLIEFEESEEDIHLIAEYMSMPLSERKKLYHVRLACDAGLMVEFADSVYRLTNSGHDYIAAVRNDGVWQQTKAVVAETGGSATLDLLKQLAIGFLKTNIEKHTGVPLG